MIQYVYSLLYPKIYNRTNNSGIQNKSSFDFAFSNWRVKKQNDGPISPKIINELPAPTKQVLVTEMLSKRKNPWLSGVQEFEQAPIAPAPKPKLAVETVEIKKEIVKSDNFDKTKGSAKKLMDVRPAKRAEKKESFQRQLSENTAKMNIIKKPRIE